MEFSLIERFFKTPSQPTVQTSAWLLGVGDDCAVLNPPAASHLYVSTDTLVQGIHFFSDADPYSVGYKSLAVSLSDLAACGAIPLGCTLNLSLPAADEPWLKAFSEGFLGLAAAAGCPLVGGDTTGVPAGGPTVLTVTVMGHRPHSHAPWLRSQVLPGQRLWVTGLPGMARLGLLAQAQLRGQLLRFVDAQKAQLFEACWHAMPAQLQVQALDRIERPDVRLSFAQAWSQAQPALPMACLDLSDGLSGDLQHLAKASACGVVLSHQALIDMWESQWPSAAAHQQVLLDSSLVGGDDYELCFALSPNFTDPLQACATAHHTPVRAVGYTTEQVGVWQLDAQGRQSALHSNSFDHFSVTTR